MATCKKTAKKARNISREPLQEHVRAERGTGRKPVASIMVPQNVKDQFEAFKEVYAARFGAATSEQVLRRWMDGIGTAFDSKVAQEARKLYRKRQQQAMDAAKSTAWNAKDAVGAGTEDLETK